MRKNFFKKIYISIILIFSIFASLLISKSNAITVQVNQVEVNSRGLIISVKADEEIQKIIMYKKDSSGNWVKFYQNSETGYTSKNFFISKYRLPTKNISDLKVEVWGKDGKAFSTSDDILSPEKPSPSPSQSTSPSPSQSASPSPSQSTSPSPSQSTSPSPSQSASPSPTPASSITLNKSKITLDMPSTTTETLKATIEPSNSKQTITWSTSNKYVATVNASGKITAVCPGSCTITAKTSNGKKATCKVIVKFRGKNVANGNKVYYIDAQDGSEASDCMLIEINGKYAMIDTSTSGHAKRIAQYLSDLNVTQLEWVLITHFDGDHYGGYATLSKKVSIKKVYMKNIDTTGHTKVKNAANSKGTKILYVTSKKNTSATLEGVTFNFYNRKIRPSNISEMAGTSISSSGKKRQNMYSIVTTATINKKKFAFLADQSAESKNYTSNDTKYLQKICNKTAKEIGDIDIYKVTHHGYNGNSLTELSYYKPDYAIITNTKRKATDTVSKRIKKYTSNVYYSGNGTKIVSVSSDGKVNITKLEADG